jgi:myo-inositol-1(or 4)-monophosphatase
VPATDPPNAAELLELASRAARAAGALLAGRALEPATGVSAKSSRTDLVSDADRDAEALIVAAIRAERPGDAITAEEGAAADGGSGLRWLVDPLDGTINYLWGIPHWCVSVAAADAEGTVVGVVHDPSRGETFTARRGAGAALDERPLRLEGAPPLAEVLLATGFNYATEERARQAARLTHVLPRVRDVRRFGAAALDLAWLAAGRVDGYLETGLSPWDWAAGALLVTEAGGAVQDLPARGGSPAGLLASRAPLAGPLRELVDASSG